MTKRNRRQFPPAWLPRNVELLPQKTAASKAVEAELKVKGHTATFRGAVLRAFAMLASKPCRVRTRKQGHYLINKVFTAWMKAHKEAAA